MALKPEPVAKSTVCSVCGLDWSRHVARRNVVAAAECIRLLKADLATANRYRSQGGIAFTGSGNVANWNTTI